MTQACAQVVTTSRQPTPRTAVVIVHMLCHWTSCARWNGGGGKQKVHQENRKGERDIAAQVVSGVGFLSSVDSINEQA